MIFILIIAQKCFLWRSNRLWYPFGWFALKKWLGQSILDNFTVTTAAAGDQTAYPLEKAKRGMFSYLLLKDMEGEADANDDNEINAGELHSYVKTNAIQQSSDSQTPKLQGDADRVLVRFQWLWVAQVSDSN